MAEKQETGGLHLRPRKRHRIALLLAFLLGAFTYGMAAAGARLVPAFAALWEGPARVPPSFSPARAASWVLSYRRGEGLRLSVLEEVPVRVEVDGTTLVAHLFLPSLTAALEEAGVVLGPRDRAELRLALEGTREAEPELVVVRVRQRVVTTSEPIPAPERLVADPILPPGRTVVRAPGEAGTLLKRYLVTTENGRETARRLLGTEVLRSPRPRLVAFGPRAPEGRLTSREGLPSGKVKKVFTMLATAYTHTGNRTASGVWPYVGGVAVDPEVIPLGTRLYVEGYGPARAVDTGGVIKGNRIDVFFETEQECLRWGKRIVNVYVLED